MTPETILRKRIHKLEKVLTDIMEADIEECNCRTCSYLVDCSETQQGDYTPCFRNMARDVLEEVEE